MKVKTLLTPIVPIHHSIQIFLNQLPFLPWNSNTSCSKLVSVVRYRNRLENAK